MWGTKTCSVGRGEYGTPLERSYRSPPKCASTHLVHNFIKFYKTVYQNTGYPDVTKANTSVGCVCVMQGRRRRSSFSSSSFRAVINVPTYLLARIYLLHLYTHLYIYKSLSLSRIIDLVQWFIKYIRGVSFQNITYTYLLTYILLEDSILHHHHYYYYVTLLEP